MRWVRLGDLISPSGRRAGTAHNLPVYSVTKHAGFVPSEHYFQKRIFSEDTSDYKVVDAGEFAYATIHLDEGSIGIAPEVAVVSPMYTVFSVDSEMICNAYLLRLLKSPLMMARYKTIGRGAVHRRKSISIVALSALKVPIPTINEQRHIVAVLDEVDARIAVRRQQIDILSETVDAALRNLMEAVGECRCRRVLLEDVVICIESGLSPACESRPAEDSEWGVLKLGAVTYGDFREYENKAYLGDLAGLRAKEVRPGDVLMARKNTPDLVGSVVLVRDVRPGLSLPDLIFRIRLDRTQVEPSFFQSLMMSSWTRPRVRALAGGSAKSMSKTVQIGRASCRERV